MGVQLTMNQPSSRQFNEAYLDIEDELKSLKKANVSIETAYSEFQSFSRREKELWDKIGKLSVGTEAERSVLREMNYLEEESQFFNGKLSEGEDELEQEMIWKRKQRDQLEESIFEARKEENKCHE